MILMLWFTICGLLEEKAKYKQTMERTRSPRMHQENSGSLNKFLKPWIVTHLVVNALWIILRAFVRNLSVILETHGVLFFNYIQQYRYAI